MNPRKGNQRPKVMAKGIAPGRPPDPYAPMRSEDPPPFGKDGRNIRDVFKDIEAANEINTCIVHRDFAVKSGVYELKARIFNHFGTPRRLPGGGDGRCGHVHADDSARSAVTDDERKFAGPASKIKHLATAQCRHVKVLFQLRRQIATPPITVSGFRSRLRHVGAVRFLSPKNDLGRME